MPRRDTARTHWPSFWTFGNRSTRVPLRTTRTTWAWGMPQNFVLAST